MRRGMSPGEAETVDLLAGLGRVLAEEILADRDFPPFDRATRDGYAVRAADLAKVPARLEVIGEVKAGDWPEPGMCSVGRGQAVEIMTGSSAASGRGRGGDGGAHVIARSARESRSGSPAQRGSAGENFVPRGAEARAGQLLLQPGRRLDHARHCDCGIRRQEPRAGLPEAARGRAFDRRRGGGDRMRRRDRPRFGIRIRIRWRHRFKSAGAEAVRLAIAPDEPDRLRALIEEGLACDLLLLTGGVSMGKYDLVEQVLAELKAEFYFTGAEIQPGSPVVFGSCSAGALARVPASSPNASADWSVHSPQDVFLWIAGESGFDHGDVRIVCSDR